MLPLRNAVLFPNAIAPMAVGRKFSLSAVEGAQAGDSMIAIFTQIDPKVEIPVGSDLHPYGVLAKILKVMDERHSNTKTVLLQGISRLKLLRFTSLSPHMRVDVEFPEETKLDDAEMEALSKKTKELALEVIQLSPNIPAEAKQFIDEIREVGALCDLIAANMSIPIEEKIKVLETMDLKARCRNISRLLNNELEMLKVKKRIDEEIRGELDKNQREFYLRKQMDAIRKELGDDDGGEGDVDEFRKRILEAGLPTEAREVADKELKRLGRIPPSSPEHTVSHNYLEWILDLPWSKSTEDHIDLKEAEQILNEDSYGLERVKKRILEYLAVRKLKPEVKGPILCLIGPPGVGKTSLGSSIARAMGRKFYRMSLGGLHDEAEIRGHRRTYIGSMPGRILQGLKKVGTRNPVFVLDELDKVGADFRGDPSSALLEVLDPEQNFSFSDNYLQIPFDLSKVLFIGTANRVDTIPPALRDRLEIIEVPGYTSEEKLVIARKHLIKEEMENHGLTPEQIQIEDEAVSYLIDSYTREAGVRELKRNIAATCRSVARDVASEDVASVEVTPEKVQKILGAERYYPEVADRTSIAGVATGMAWTPTGGDILFIEASMMKGKGNLILTGQLGDVMQESAKAALSYIRSKAGGVQHRPGRVPELRHPRAHPGGRDFQGRPVRGHHAAGGAGEPAHGTQGQPGRGHDRRGHAARPRAAGRRHQGKNPRGEARGHQENPVARTQQKRPGGNSRSAARGRGVPLHRQHRGRAEIRARSPAHVAGAGSETTRAAGTARDELSAAIKGRTKPRPFRRGFFR
ncbi:MAG: endopeptidase La [Deltaproteobacteria bacterium]|nr:endopeptidase La [Deltaproteobacteria bacterium]